METRNLSCVHNNAWWSADKEYRRVIAEKEKEIETLKEKLKALEWELKQHNSLSRISKAEKQLKINNES